MEAKDIIASIMAEAEHRASQLAQDTEGHFEQGDIEGIYEDAWLSIYKAGIREVVEWIEKVSGHFTSFNPEDLLPHHCSTCDNSIVGVTEYQWQAQLKEWGIDE